jgi:serine phosphatase RsbU (regulator of sigma subunit)
MERDTGEHLSPSRRRERLAVAALCVCCVSCLASIPIAAARSDRSRPSTAATQAPAAAAPPAQRAPVSAPSQTTVPPRSTTPSHAGRRGDGAGANDAPAQGSPGGRHHGGHDGAAVDSQQPASAPEAPDAPAPSEQQRGNGAQRPGHLWSSRREPSRQRGGRPDQGTRAGAQAVREPSAGRQQAVVDQQASKGQRGSGHARGGHHKEGGKGPERSREHGKRGKTRAPKPPTAPGGSQSSPSLLSASVASAPASSAPAAVAPPTSATPAPAIAVSQPTVVRRAPQVLTRPSRKPGDGTTGQTPPVSHVPAAAPVLVAAAVAPAHTRTHARPGHPARADGSTPLVTTITRIVDVVPTPVRILIAGLLVLALALAARSAVVALRARRLVRQRAQLLEDVGLLQAALLPVPPARLGPVGTTAAYRPAAGPGAGGDFYDVFALEDGQLGIVVGDVSGHGRQALPHTALLRFTLRAYLEAGLSPRDAVQTAGAVLERQLEGQFATVVAATYHPRERVLVYACAGHPPPVVLGPATGSTAIAPITVCSSPPIGVGMRTGTRQTSVSVPGRSQVCFYTDGVTEARVGSELFGSERLASTLSELGPAATASAILDRVAQQADARPDDMATCLLSVEGGEDPPTVLVEELELDRDESAGARAERFLLAFGFQRRDAAEVVRAAHRAAGDVGSVVLELRRTEGSPEVTLRRDHLAYLPLRSADVGVPQ